MDTYLLSNTYEKVQIFENIVQVTHANDNHRAWIGLYFQKSRPHPYILPFIIQFYIFTIKKEYLKYLCTYFTFFSAYEFHYLVGIHQFHTQSYHLHHFQHGFSCSIQENYFLHVIRKRENLMNDNKYIIMK